MKNKSIFVSCCFLILSTFIFTSCGSMTSDPHLSYKNTIDCSKVNSCLLGASKELDYLVFATDDGIHVYSSDMKKEKFTISTKDIPEYADCISYYRHLSFSKDNKYALFTNPYTAGWDALTQIHNPVVIDFTSNSAFALTHNDDFNLAFEEGTTNYSHSWAVDSNDVISACFNVDYSGESGFYVQSMNLNGDKPTNLHFVPMNSHTVIMPLMLTNDTYLIYDCGLSTLSILNTTTNTTTEIESAKEYFSYNETTLEYVPVLSTYSEDRNTICFIRASFDETSNYPVILKRSSDSEDFTIKELKDFNLFEGKIALSPDGNYMAFINCTYTSNHQFIQPETIVLYDLVEDKILQEVPCQDHFKARSSNNPTTFQALYWVDDELWVYDWTSKMLDKYKL